MKIRAHILTTLLSGLLLIAALCRPSPAFALSTIAASSGGDGVFLLQGIGIEDAAALDVTVSYDTATLANPRVVTGPLVAGGMNAVNANVPGQVHMVIVRLTPVKGSGVIATLTFDQKGSSPGAITSLSAKLANINGAPLPSLVQVNNPTAPSTTAPETQQGQETPAGTSTSPGQTAGTSGAPSTIAPTIIIAGPPSTADAGTVPPDSQSAKEGEGQTSMPASGQEGQKEPMVAVRSTEGGSSAHEAASSENRPARKIFSQKGALDRFEEYRGERTIRALASLFEQDSYIGFRQEPPVALSDGTSLVRVTFLSTPGNRTTSDVAVMGARLISMRRDPDNSNTWIVDLQPERGAYRASLTVSQGNIAMVYPLTVAPKIALDRSRSGIMTETEYDRYLNERPAGKSPTLDLNRDGKWDYQDDYILTANYLDAVRNRPH